MPRRKPGSLICANTANQERGSMFLVLSQVIVIVESEESPGTPEKAWDIITNAALSSVTPRVLRAILS